MSRTDFIKLTHTSEFGSYPMWIRVDTITGIEGPDRGTLISYGCRAAWVAESAEEIFSKINVPDLSADR